MSDEGKNPAASQRIADVIAERILSGALAPGTRIIQDELADELRTSRIPVREALRILDARGLVTLRVNSGAWVSEMTLHDLGVSYEIRERIEPLLLVDSMANVTQDDLKEMADIQVEIEKNAGVEEFLKLDRAFHWASYRRHRAPQLAEIVARLWDSTQHYRRAFVRLNYDTGSWISASEHHLLLDALRSKNADIASTVLVLHIRRTRLALTEHPQLFADNKP
jgi:DNA-binding GntR family transcriptional regulator